MRKICAIFSVGLLLGLGTLINANSAKSQGTAGQGSPANTSSATTVGSGDRHFRFQELILGMSVQDARQALSRMGMRITERGIEGSLSPAISGLAASTSDQDCSTYEQPGICHRVLVHYGSVPPQRVVSIRVEHRSGSYISLVAIERALIDRYGSPSQSMTTGNLTRLAEGGPSFTRLDARWGRRETNESVVFTGLAPGPHWKVDSIGGLQSFAVEISSQNFRNEAEAAFVEFVRRQPVPAELRF
jgi:hypothetical protein